MSEWIKCSDRIPEHNGVFLVIYDGRRCCADFSSMEWFVDKFFDDTENPLIFSCWNDLHRATQNSITHWMEIPALPEGISSEEKLQ